MKRLLHTFLLFSIPYLLTAQDGINWVYGTDHYTEGSNIRALPDGSWLVSGYSAGRNNNTQLTPIIGHYTNSGWEAFELTDTFTLLGELGQLSEVLYDTTTDQYHLVLGQGVCDVAIPNVLLSFGALGSWQTPIDFSADREWALCTVPGDGFIWSPKQNPALIWQKGPTNIVELEYDWEENEKVLALRQWQPGILLVQTQTEIRAFSFNDNGALLTGSYTPSSSASSIQAIEVLDEDRLVVLENDSLRILNNALESIVQVAIEGEGTEHLSLDEESIYLLQELPADGLYAFFFDHNLTEDGRTAINLGDYELGDMAAADGRIALVGAQEYTNTVGGAEPNNSQLFVRTYTVNGPDIPDEHDIEIAGITTGELLFNLYPSGPCGRGQVLDLEIEVKNNSPFPVQEVLLKYEYDPASICPSICDPYITRTQHYTELDLQSGATVSLPFDPLWIDGLSNVDEFELCLNITAPNHPMELNLMNNSSCETIVVIDTDNIPLQEESLSIFPNPVSELLSLELPAETKRIVVYDAAGQMVYQEITQNSIGWYELTVTTLPNGLYFIKALTEQGIYTGRFIKQ